MMIADVCLCHSLGRFPAGALAGLSANMTFLTIPRGVETGSPLVDGHVVEETTGVESMAANWEGRLKLAHCRSD
jgi:hypothetical protein